MTKKAIVADDSEDWRGIHVSTIKEAFPNVQVDEAKTGAELVELVLAGDYSLVISDNDMETISNGLYALKRIREAGNKVPFYLISGRVEFCEDALKLGATGSYSRRTSLDREQMAKDISKHLE